VGAGETQQLVDHQLHKEQAVRDKIADTTGSLKEQAKRTYLALQKAQKEEADANNLKRHLKEQLEIISAEAKEKQEVAMKADAIAKKMEEMAAKADGAYEEVQATEEKTAAGYASAKSDYDARTEAESVAEKLRREAEDKAQAASSKLEEADKHVRELLQKHQRLEDMKMAEDEKQTTRLADAFKEDAQRQNAFKHAILQAKLAENRQQQLIMKQNQKRDREAQDMISERKSKLSFKKETSISKLKALEHALLRANPELDVFRHGDGKGEDSDRWDASKRQTLSGGTDEEERDSSSSTEQEEEGYQASDKARWQELAQVVRHVGQGWGEASESDDFTVPSSSTPRV